MQFFNKGKCPMSQKMPNFPIEALKMPGWQHLILINSREGKSFHKTQKPRSITFFLLRNLNDLSLSKTVNFMSLEMFHTFLPSAERTRLSLSNLRKSRFFYFIYMGFYVSGKRTSTCSYYRARWCCSGNGVQKKSVQDNLVVDIAVSFAISIPIRILSVCSIF